MPTDLLGRRARIEQEDEREKEGTYVVPPRGSSAQHSKFNKKKLSLGFTRHPLQVPPVDPHVGFDSYQYIFVWTSAILVVRPIVTSSKSHVFGLGTRNCIALARECLRLAGYHRSDSLGT
jgi:hypothetical protein